MQFKNPEESPMFSVPDHIQWSIRRELPRTDLCSFTQPIEDQKQADDSDPQLKRITVLTGNFPKKL